MGGRAAFERPRAAAQPRPFAAPRRGLCPGPNQDRRRGRGEGGACWAYRGPRNSAPRPRGAGGKKPGDTPTRGRRRGRGITCPPTPPGAKRPVPGAGSPGERGRSRWKRICKRAGAPWGFPARGRGGGRETEPSGELSLDPVGGVVCGISDPTDTRPLGIVQSFRN
jgi:hypothetical protein